MIITHNLITYQSESEDRLKLLHKSIITAGANSPNGKACFGGPLPKFVLFILKMFYPSWRKQLNWLEKNKN